MKKIFTLIAVAAMAISVNAQTSASVTWSLAENTEGVANPTTAAAATAVAVGEGLAILDDRYAFSDITFLQLQATSDDKGNNKYASCAELKKYADFKFTASQDFTVTSVSLDIVKKGTGDPNVYLAILDNAGTETLIAGGDATKEASATVIRRNNDSDETPIHQTFTVDNVAVATGNAFTFRLYVGKLANNKQVGVANVVIGGTVVPTGINTVKAVEAENGAAYNLAGQKVADDFKGVVIKNGKKMIQK